MGKEVPNLGRKKYVQEPVATTITRTGMEIKAKADGVN